MSEETNSTEAVTDPPTEVLGDAGLAALKVERQALKKEKAASGELRRRLEAIEKSLGGLDPEEARKLKEAQAVQEEMQAKFDQELEAAKVEAQKEAKAQLEIKDKKFLDAVGERNSLLQTQLLSNAFQVAGGRSGGGEDGSTYFDALMGAVGNQFKLNENGDVVVLDQKGELKLDDSGDPLKPADYLEGLKSHPVYGHFFSPKSSGHGGGMRGQGNLTSGSAKGMTALEKLQYGLGGHN